MLDLLGYIKDLRYPSRKITATERLCLMILILEGGGLEIEVDEERLAVQLSLANSKSVYRILSKLNDGILLRLTPRKDARGHNLPALAYVLPYKARSAQNPSNIQVTTLDPSNLDVTRGEPSYIGEPPSYIEETPSNIQVTTLDPSNLDVTKPEAPEIRDETRETGSGESGTSFALNTPSSNLILFKGGERRPQEPSNLEETRLTENAAVKIWFEVVQSDSITEEAARLIIKRVPEEELSLVCWRETLEGWVANPQWSKTNIDGQVSRYVKKLERGEFTKPALRKPQEESEEDKRAREETRRIMYERK